MHKPVYYHTVERFKTPVLQFSQVNRIHMTVDGQYLLSLTYPSDHIAKTVYENLIKSGLFHLALQLKLHILLSGGQGLDPDQLRQVPSRVVPVFLREFIDPLIDIIHSI